MFPVFTDLRGKNVLVIGAGRIAERRIRTLSRFSAHITVIAPVASSYIEHAASDGNMTLLRREYEPGDITELAPALVIAATNFRKVNRQAGAEARQLGIPVSVADAREECTFYFPALALSDTMIVGMVSTDGDHKAVAKTAEQIRKVIST